MGEHTKTPWRVDPHCFSIYADDVPKGPMRVADIRGWGYLTGKGHGALGLPDHEAMAIQVANAELIVKATAHHDALVKALEELQSAETVYRMCHDLDGDGNITAGSAWDKMKQAGNRARSLLADISRASTPTFMGRGDDESPNYCRSCNSGAVIQD